MTEEQRKFKEAWEAHAKSFASLAFQATASPEEFDAFKAIVADWVSRTHTMRKES